MLDFLELEETVGKAWHRLVGQTRSTPRYPEHAVALDEIKPMLASCFRGFGGDHAVQLVAAHQRTSKHRLKLRQLVGLGEERLARSGRDFARAMLPEVIDFFPDRTLNRELFIWLTAAVAMLPAAQPTSTDPLIRDLERLHLSTTNVEAALAAFPGLRPAYRRLCAATLAERHRGKLPAVEQLLENRIVSLLRTGAGLPDDLPQAIFPHHAPPGYQPMMDVPLWPEFFQQEESRSSATDSEAPLGDPQGSNGGRRFSAQREREDEKRSDRSPFILNRFEKILAMAEMVNVDRPTDDTPDEDGKAAEDLDEMVLGHRRERPSSRFRFDLDLPPEMVDLQEIAADLTYPEWDYRKAAYLKNHCRVLAVPVAASGDRLLMSDDTKALVRKVRKQFEILRPRQELLKSQLDGGELDLDAVVRRRTDLVAGGQGTDRIHITSQPRSPDLTVTILVDVSLSTDAWIDNRRVLDVEKEALLVLSQGLTGCDTDHSILTFTSRRRSWVRIETVKGFDERLSPGVEDRIAGLKPGYYTRLGAAMRHATSELAKRPNRTRLLLVLTDGKPNDIDHYEGRFALEDSRRAVQEARRQGVNVFAVTVDRDAKSYLPTMFGRNGYAVVGNISKLPAALPAIYRGLTG
ncbi:nitric oxide reductase NorD protein [Rhizobium petrolearium]|uniref:nitric oxide reductase activation protein NorD n=1 Tax=Neorhizobium petrolearium TaxID=515361 RepID=UPI001AE2C52F|nr:VWA domain-containing protein [Neorhizobium petrolearium]MBP1844206.1 nitric oxide reductase NorD protein [Neorhizobium petrolearium]